MLQTFAGREHITPVALVKTRRFERRHTPPAERAGHAFSFRSERLDLRGHAAAFSARYEPDGDQVKAPAGSLEAFLVERYCLYSMAEDGEVLRADIHHPPASWPRPPSR